jgi:D-aminopeptidase
MADQQSAPARPRARDLGIVIGQLPAGPLDAITDVEGVLVGHATIRRDGPSEVGSGPVRTGVTVVRPRAVEAWREPVFAGYHRLNGNGEMTGLPWIEEAGVLASPIALTNTHSVGVVRDELVAMEVAERGTGEVAWSLPVVSETWDGWLNDINGQHVRGAHVREAYGAAAGGPVVEGAVGSGTGMICHDLKGGIGTASRVLPDDLGGWTVGALVQANHGGRFRLCVDGYPVGRVLDDSVVPGAYSTGRDVAAPGAPPAGTGSIVVVLATDAPLLPDQCRRLAQRATIGVARTGGGVEDSSGDLFLAFATGNSGIPIVDYAAQTVPSIALRSVTHPYMTGLFRAAADAVEEAIVNCLLAAVTTDGWAGRTAFGVGADRLVAALRQVGWQPTT